MAFIITLASAFIASIFTAKQPDELINLYGDKFIGAFIFMFPVYYVYKKSKDNVNPNSKLSNKYIFGGTILALSTLLVICHYNSESSIAIHTEDVIYGNKTTYNNNNRLLELQQNDLPPGYFEEKQIFGFKVIFPCKTREKQIETNWNKYTRYENVPVKGIPYMRAECFPVKLIKCQHKYIEQFIKTTLNKYAEDIGSIRISQR